MRRVYASCVACSMMLLCCVVPVAAQVAVGAPAESWTDVSACGALTGQNTRYRLTANLDCDDSAFPLKHSGITLFLNGKTVTYGANPSVAGKARFGISLVACSNSTVQAGGEAEGADCGWTALPSGFTLLGPGTIQKHASAASKSHVILFRPTGGGTLNPFMLSGATLAVTGGPSQPFFGNLFGQGGGHMRGLTINYTANNDSLNRSAFEGQAANFADSTTAAPAVFFGNTITGFPQGGIRRTGPRTLYLNNTISGTSRWENDFALVVQGDSSRAIGNTINCIPGGSEASCRGIQVDDASHAYIGGNTVQVRVLANNQNVGGAACEAGGSYGIQLEINSRFTRIEGNTFEAYSDDCEARALRLTSNPQGSGNRSSGNQYKAIRVGSGTLAIAFSAVSSYDFTSTDDTWTFDGTGIDLRSGSGFGDNFKFIRSTWTIGANPSAGVRTFFLKPTANPDDGVSTIYVIDPSFTNGAAATDVEMEAHATRRVELYLQWTRTIICRRQSDNAVLPGCIVTVTDALSSVVYRNAADANGQVAPVLTEWRKYNSTGTAVNTDAHTPHSAAVSYPGCTDPGPTAVNATATGSTTITMTGC